MRDYSIYNPQYRDLPVYPTVIHALHCASLLNPDTTALICDGREISYRQYAGAVAGLAGYLRDRGMAGKRIALVVPNSIEAAVALLACLAAGAQAAPLNPFFTAAELEELLNIAEPAMLICHGSVAEKIVPSVPRPDMEEPLIVGEGGLGLDPWLQDPSLTLNEAGFPAADDPALLLFTGGTTGIPKAAHHRHRSVCVSFSQHCTMWPISFGEERFLTVTPMFHIWGLWYALWVPLYARSPLVIIPRYDAEVVATALSEQRITVFGGGPAPIYMGLLHSRAIETGDFTRLKYSLSGGAPCPAELHNAWRAKTGCVLLEGWGMTEGAPFCLNPAQGERKLMSVGVPVPETEIQVVDLETGTKLLPAGETGEARVRGPQLAQGYRSNPEETRSQFRDGWLYTGDIGYLDEDGYFFIVDRKKELVIVGGYNVYPRQVDEILFRHPAIAEVATVGKTHPELGETLVAFVGLKPGATLTREGFFEYCRENMVKYKRPTEVYFVDTLPRSGVAKINKLALKKMAAKRETVT